MICSPSTILFTAINPNFIWGVRKTTNKPTKRNIFAYFDHTQPIIISLSFTFPPTIAAMKGVQWTSVENKTRFKEVVDLESFIARSWTFCSSFFYNFQSCFKFKELKSSDVVANFMLLLWKDLIDAWYFTASCQSNKIYLFASHYSQLNSIIIKAMWKWNNWDSSLLDIILPLFYFVLSVAEVKFKTSLFDRHQRLLRSINEVFVPFMKFV